METSDGRPSSLAYSLSAASNGDAPDPSVSRTAAEAIAQNNGASGRLMTKEERKRLAQAIENSDSLEEIRKLEERLRLGYAVEETQPASNPSKRKGGEEEHPASPAEKRKKR